MKNNRSKRKMWNKNIEECLKDHSKLLPKLLMYQGMFSMSSNGGHYFQQLIGEKFLKTRNIDILGIDQLSIEIYSKHLLTKAT